MRKMYCLAVISIFAITILFLFFYNDENSTCIKLLNRFGYETESQPFANEKYIIPRKFDNSLTDYNLMQLSQGFDLSQHKGKNALKYTYKITNCPELSYTLLANFILVNGKIVSVDLANPRIDGFLLPLIHKTDLIKYHTPAISDAQIP